MASADVVQSVYREFGPGPIQPERQTELYVDLEDVRGSMNVVSRLSERIRLAEGRPTCQVLAGHKGSGKSTELLRLKKQLETGPSPFFVVNVQADDDIDRNDVDLPDILIAIVRQMAAQLKLREGIKLKPGYFKDRFQRLGGLLKSEVNLDSFELGYGMMKLAGTLKASPDARRDIRKILDPDTNNWLTAANDVIGEAVQQLGKKGKAGLVILLDDLDKMTIRPHDAGCTTDEYLFINRAAQLTAFLCHVVYTIPLSLAYSHQEQAIKNSYGGQVPVVPMTKIAARPPRKGAYKPGVEKFRQVLARRLEAAGVPAGEVFRDDGVRDQLISLSGGQPDQLMMLVREAIIAHGLPITKDSLDRARREGRREFARLLRQEHWPIIREIGRTGTFNRTSEKESAFREMLQCRAILQYVNAEEWYGLNPMVDLKLPVKTK